MTCHVEPTDLKLKMAEVWQRLKVTILTVGSMASIAYGEPRLTNDIDMVVDLPLEQADPLCMSFRQAPDYYCYRESVLRDSGRFHFSIIHLESGLTVDVFIPDGSEFSQSQLSRAVRTRLGADFDVGSRRPKTSS